MRHLVYSTPKLIAQGFCSFQCHPDIHARFEEPPDWVICPVIKNLNGEAEWQINPTQWQEVIAVVNQGG